METVLDKLPNHIRTEIMCYSHPDITFKYNMVLTQMLYYAKDYCRNQSNWSPIHHVKFVNYMLRRCDKMGCV